MNSQITGLRVASVIFGLIAIPQLVRLAIRPEVLVAGHLIPLWPSMLAIIIFGGLSISMWIAFSNAYQSEQLSRLRLDPVFANLGA